MAHAEPEETQQHFCYLEESPAHLMERRSQGHPPRLVTEVPVESSGRPSLVPHTELEQGMLVSGPPEITASWLFTVRAAAPVRAPSPAS